MRSDGYKTKQRAAVEELLRQSGDHVTVDELVDRLGRAGHSVGRTTVYRCLERLAAEGHIRKYVAEKGESACYQYIDGQKKCEEHFHLRCSVCGKLIHMECDHMNDLAAHIAAEHGFRVDPLKTVLYGLCQECADQ